jgi:putative aldouronate transport system permease protein
MGIRQSAGETSFDVLNYLLLAILGITTTYPLIFVIANSLSGNDALLRAEVFLWPKEFTWEAYESIFIDGGIFLAYYNTLWYTVVGTLVNVALTLMAAYPLSRKGYSLRSGVMVFLAITMFFSGGMVPTYLLIRSLGLYNSRWVMVIPAAVGTMNIVITRVFFQTNVPEELTDAARIDGAHGIQIFYLIAIPMSKPIIAVLSLFYGVGHWNDFMTPLIYLQNSDLHPLSLYLRRILVLGTTNYETSRDVLLWEDVLTIQAVTLRIKYATIVVTMLPIMVAYPFLQKYFVKGVMIGALKE